MRFPVRFSCRPKSYTSAGGKTPSIPAWDFKRISRKLPVYSIRIGRSWRALGRRDEDAVTWFWIGSHEAYNKLLVKF